MSYLKILALFLGIAAIPVLNLARSALELVWTGSLRASDALLMVSLVGGLAFLVALAVIKIRPGHKARIVSVLGWFLLGFSHVGLLRNRLYGAGWVDRWQWFVLVLAIAAIAAWVGTRLDPAARYLMTLVPTLVVVQGVLLATAVAQTTNPTPFDPTEATYDIGSPPSIWMIVLDAHASPSVLEQYHDVDLAAQVAALESHGFRVWNDARANYSQTLVSIPSVLSGELWDPAAVQSGYGQMLAGVQGDTPLVASIRQSGASIRMVPANWSRSRCGALIDECVAAASINDHWWFLLQSTPLPDLAPRMFPHPWPVGGLKSLAEIAALPAVERHFTFVHSLASHPPTILDRQCRTESASQGDLQGQLECTHQVLLEAIQQIDLEGDAVIILADHGYAVGNVTAPADKWSDETARNRLSAFVAVSTPKNCETAIPEDLSTAQILPYVLNCHGADLPIPPHRFMKVNHQRYGGLGATELVWDGWSAYAP